MTHPFTLGVIYENRNGIYEAVRIDEKQDVMLIRHIDTGEEIESTVTVQSPIWQNMQWEREEEERHQAAVEAGYQKGYGRDFTGLYDSDFKTNTEGTTWRSRASLAGRVSQLLSADTLYTFVSWAIYGWPVAFLTYREDYEMRDFREYGEENLPFLASRYEVSEQALWFRLLNLKLVSPADQDPHCADTQSGCIRFIQARA